MVGFSFRPSQGASVSIVTLWDVTEVEVFASRSIEHGLIIQGMFSKSGVGFSLVNVYTP